MDPDEIRRRRREAHEAERARAARLAEDVRARRHRAVAERLRSFDWAKLPPTALDEVLGIVRGHLPPR